MAAPIVVGVLLGLVLATPPAAATQTFPGPPSIEHLAHRADLIVVGEVLAATGEWDAARTNIHTRIELSVAEWLKGAASSPVTFTQLGGRVGGEASLVGGAVTFQPGQRVLLFLTRRPDGSLGLTDLANGAFSLLRDAATGRDHVLRATGAPGADRFELDDVRRRIRRAVGGQR